MASHTVGTRHIASIDGKRFESKVQTGSARGWEKKLTPVGNRTWFDERTRAALFRTSMIGDEDMHQPSRTAIGSDGGSAESWTTPFIANGTAEPASNGSHPAEHIHVSPYIEQTALRVSPGLAGPCRATMPCPGRRRVSIRHQATGADIRRRFCTAGKRSEPGRPLEIQLVRKIGIRRNHGPPFHRARICRGLFSTYGNQARLRLSHKRQSALLQRCTQRRGSSSAHACSRRADKPPPIC